MSLILDNLHIIYNKVNNTVSGESSLNFCLEILGELDDQLAPIGKELFSMEEDDNSEWDDEDLMGEARPGTTKRNSIT